MKVIKQSLVIVTLLLSLAFNNSLMAQVFINELDSDSPSIDDKEILELRTLAPYTSLNGFIVVLYNGNPSSSTANLSYYTIDLNGFSTDTNGIFTIGSVGVSPVPDLVIPDNIIQNGQDAVAIYSDLASNFPDGTLATSTNLVHALAYDTGDPDAIALMALLGITTPQIDENENSAQATESIQRKANGTYEVKVPTPGAMNDGTGFVYNGLTINVNTAHRTEGDTIHIHITSQTPVNANTNFNLNLSNGGFNSTDYTGNIAVNMPAGTSSFNTIITIVDDVADEGDEVLKVKFGNLPFGFNKLNDKIEIRIVDNDFATDPWGTPLNPTYGIVNSNAPSSYYASLNGLSSNALFNALQNIIADSNVVRAHCYGDVPQILMTADRNPKNNNEVWLMYVEKPMPKLDYQITSSGVGKWNREHIYPQSRGGFSNGTSDSTDGVNIYTSTNANDILAGHADAHHLRAEDATENSTRNNKDYGGSDYNGPANTKNSWRGDVARASLYMAVRYNGLQVVPGNPADNTVGQLGDLDSLLAWNKSDPRDDFEMNRNNYIYSVWQKNRNPFIDYPELADYIWGSKIGETWSTIESVNAIQKLSFVISPNPTRNTFNIHGLNGKAKVSITNILGEVLATYSLESNGLIPCSFAAGIYAVQVIGDGKMGVQRLVVE